MARPVLILLLAAFAASMVSASEFHVTTTGDDDDTGGTLDPWQTIQHAASTATAGDTVIVHGGTYSEAVVFANDGTAQQPITFRAATGETVIVDGAGITLPGWGGLLTISERQHIVIDGLQVRHAGPNNENAGILIDESNHIAVRNCTTYDTRSSGIGAWDSTDIEILDNRIELACNDGSQECLTVAGTDGFLVRGNEVFNGGPGTQGGEGIDLKDGSSNGLVEHNHVHDLNRLGIYVDSWDDHTHDIVVRNNTVHDIQASGMAVAAENGGLLQDIWIYNNVVHQNRYTGITIAGWGEPVPSHPIDRVWIVHNTFVDNGDTWGGGILFENTDATNVVVRNNLVSENLSFQIADEGSGAGTVVDHNLIDGFRGDTFEIWGTAPLTGNPHFVSPATRDFRIEPGSAAVDTASASDAVTTDHDRGARPLGAGFDVGAFEYGNVFSDDFEFGSTIRWDGA
jgi:nitrous oxidase accessory protein NosD